VTWRERIAESRAARDAAARRRVRRTIARREAMRCEVDGRALLNFCSNDYLGLSQHPQVIAAWRDAAVDGVGSTASHLVCGHHALHEALEREVADWLETPRALLFGSGFAANLAVLQALLREGDACVQDRLNHASLIDAARLSGAMLRRYPHADVDGAARQMRAAGARRGDAAAASQRSALAEAVADASGTARDPSNRDLQRRRAPTATTASRHDASGAAADIVEDAVHPSSDGGAPARTAASPRSHGAADPLTLLATDGVFSMDGDVAPLADLAALARRHDALLYVDEAHAVGVLGREGRGSVDAAGLDVRDVPLRLATLGKALGTHGAVVAGVDDLIGHLAETARGYVYTTALPPPLAAAALAAVRLARGAEDRRAHLASLVSRFRDHATRRGLDVLASTTPIQAVMAFDDRRALAMSHHLEDAGLWVSAIRPPTVPEGRARLRVTLTALHSAAEVDALVDALARARDAVHASQASA
jgi:7-keto-8-aminopelargonate synthetase-like enzyme